MALNVPALVGSLRRASFNRMAYKAALELKPGDVNIIAPAQLTASISAGFRRS